MSTLLSSIKRNSHVRKLIGWYLSISQRERVLVSLAALGLMLFLLSYPVSAFSSYIEDTKRRVEVRKNDYEKIIFYLKRYQSLNAKLEKLRASFNESQMTFEQVTADLDKIIKSSIGDNNYNLTKSGAPKTLGEEFEKQDFGLEIRSINLDQLVKLLYNFEQGSSPLFLGNVDITKGQKSGDFRARLKVTTISAR